MAGHGRTIRREAKSVGRATRTYVRTYVRGGRRRLATPFLASLQKGTRRERQGAEATQTAARRSAETKKGTLSDRWKGIRTITKSVFFCARHGPIIGATLSCV